MQDAICAMRLCQPLEEFRKAGHLWAVLGDVRIAPQCGGINLFGLTPRLGAWFASIRGGNFTLVWASVCA
jgi:hypothetical protein